MLEPIESRSGWEHMPNLEPATYYSRIPGNQATFNQYQLFRVRKKKLSRDKLLLLGLVGLTMTVVQIWQEAFDNAIPLNGAPMPVPEPKVSDMVAGKDGVQWVVMHVEEKLFGDVHNLIAQKKLANKSAG